MLYLHARGSNYPFLAMPVIISFIFSVLCLQQVALLNPLQENAPASDSESFSGSDPGTPEGSPSKKSKLTNQDHPVPNDISPDFVNVNWIPAKRSKNPLHVLGISEFFHKFQASLRRSGNRKLSKGKHIDSPTEVLSPVQGLPPNQVQKSPPKSALNSSPYYTPILTPHKPEICHPPNCPDTPPIHSDIIPSYNSDQLVSPYRMILESPIILPKTEASSLRHADPSEDPHKVYERIKAGLLSLFSSNPSSESKFYRILRNAHAAKSKLTQDERIEDSKTFLEMFCSGTIPSEEQQPVDSIRFRQICIKCCSTNFGYAFVPEEGYIYTGDVTDFFSNGELIPLTHGEVSREKHNAPRKTRPGHTAFACDCKINPDFFELMVAHKIDFIRFQLLKQSTASVAVDFVKKSFRETGVQLLTFIEFQRWIELLFRKYKVPGIGRQLARGELKKQLKSARGESDSEADEEYWKDMEF